MLFRKRYPSFQIKLLKTIPLENISDESVYWCLQNWEENLVTVLNPENLNMTNAFIK